MAPLLPALLLLWPCVVLAGTTGKLSGRVMDGLKKQPLAGVNVAVPAARTGAITDEQGRYVIVNIPAGTYEVKFNLLGYRAVTVQNVIVSADNTTNVDDVVVLEAPVAMEEIVVSARRPVVDLKITSNLATVNRAQIQKLPVQELQDIVNLQAGVVDGHVRGGRAGEVQYQVDGVTVNDPVDNKAGLRLDRSLLEEVQVISGTFDAEYGQAMSGVVNAVLRRGTDTFRWDAEAYGGGFVYPGDAGARGIAVVQRPLFELYDFPGFHLGAVHNLQVSMSGPTLFPFTTFLLNAHGYAFDDYIDATRRFSPWKVPLFLKTDSLGGNGEQMPLGYTHEWSGVAKVTNRRIPHVQLDYQAIVDVVEGRKNNYQYHLNPDGLTKQHTHSVVQGLDVTHTLSKTTFYTLSARQNLFDYRDLKYDDPYDPRYDLAGPPLAYPAYEHGAFIQGVDESRYKRWTNTPILKGSFVSQLSHDLQIKVGGEYQWPHVEFGTPGYLVYHVGPNDSLARYFNQLPNYPGIPRYRPDVAAAFAQEDLEWNDLRVRAGVRLDYFSPRTFVPSDLANPADSIKDVPHSHLVPTTRKVSFSPRIGVSYPITRKSALFFAYGHFYQFPELGQIFNNADYQVLADLQSGGISYGVLGNPDIKPQRTVQYQFGFKQSITDDFGIDLSMFYKDIRNLLGVEFITTYNGAEYARFANVDFGNVLGITASVSRRSGRLLSSTLDYTWQLAQGDASDPRETATRAQNNEDPRPRSVPFDWDQRHTLVLTVTAARPAEFNVSTIIRASSGQPFTPLISGRNVTGLEVNSGRKPNVLVVDLRGERSLPIGGIPANLFVRVSNLLDTRFNNGFVFAPSGNPYAPGLAGFGVDQMADPTRFYPPLRIELGLSLQVGD